MDPFSFLLSFFVGRALVPEPPKSVPSPPPDIVAPATLVRPLWPALQP